MFTDIINFRYMVGLLECLQYYLLLVVDGLCKRVCSIFLFSRHILNILWPILSAHTSFNI